MDHSNLPSSTPSEKSTSSGEDLERLANELVDLIANHAHLLKPAIRAEDVRDLEPEELLALERASAARRCGIRVPSPDLTVTLPSDS